jgi:hypothetical protein
MNYWSRDGLRQRNLRFVDKRAGAGRECDSKALWRLTLPVQIRYDRRLSVCSGKDNKAESAGSKCGTTI